MRKRVKKSAHFHLGKTKYILYIIILVALFIGFAWAQTNYVYVNNLTFKDVNIPCQYTGYKIAHISNIDNQYKNVKSQLKKAKPDIIIVTGGLVDENGAFDKSVNMLNDFSSIATTLYVAQQGDVNAIDTIKGATKAQYIDSETFLLPDRTIDVSTYIENNCDKDVRSEIKKNTDRAQEYVQAVQDMIDTDSIKTVQLIGINGLDDNIYNVKDNIYDLEDYTSEYRLLAIGSLKNATNLVSSGVNMVLVGGGYGLKDNGEYASGSFPISDYQLFSTQGICKDLPKKYNTKRFMNFPEIQIITLDDNRIEHRNVLEQFIGKFVRSVDVMNADELRSYSTRYENGEANTKYDDEDK